MDGPGSRSRAAAARCRHRDRCALREQALARVPDDLAECVAPAVEVVPHAVGVTDQSARARLRLLELGGDREAGVAPEALRRAVLGADAGDGPRERLALDPPDRPAELSGGDASPRVGEHRRARRVEQAPPCGHTRAGGRAGSEAWTLLATYFCLMRRADALALLLLGALAFAPRLAYAG